MCIEGNALYLVESGGSFATLEIFAVLAIVALTVWIMLSAWSKRLMRKSEKKLNATQEVVTNPSMSD